MNKIIALTVAVLPLLACLTGCNKSQINDPDEAAIELIKVSGTEAQLESMIAMMTQQMPADNANAFRGMINTSELVKRLVPVYKKHFTLDEMNDMINFHKSSTGLKLKQLGPTLIKENGDIGQKYMEEKMAAMRSVR